MNTHASLPIGTRAAFSVLVGFALLCASVLAAPLATVAGDWQGSLDTGGSALRVVIHIVSGKEGALTATMDSPDQGATGIEVTNVTYAGRDLHFEVPRIGGRFDGKADEELSKIAGDWKQGTASLPLTLKRVAK